MECDGVAVILECSMRGILAACLLILVLSNMQSALAESHPVVNVRDALKNIKPSGGSCTQKEANKPKPSKVAPVAEVKPDLSCAVAPVDLANLLQSADTVLIDTRSATDFANYHIDGAMNLSSTELRSKSFLREKSVVLIGNGKAEREQYIDCKRLKSNSFKRVKVLRGGMPGWLVSGQTVLGQPPNPAQLARLTPSDLWIESRFDANLVLVAMSQAALQKQFANSLLIPDEKPKTVQAAIEHRKTHSKSRSLAAVMLIADKDIDFQALSQAIKPLPLLVYAETADAFTHYVAQQKIVWEAQARGPKQPSGCGR